MIKKKKKTNKKKKKKKNMHVLSRHENNPDMRIRYIISNIASTDKSN